MTKLWTNFAKYGEPKFDDVVWKPIDSKSFYYLDLGNDVKIGTNPNKERMEFWDDIFKMHDVTKAN